MAVEALLVRFTPARIDRAPGAHPTCFRPRSRSSSLAAEPDRGVIVTDRLLRLDEWSATLVAPGNLDPEHPLAQAVRFGNHPSPASSSGTARCSSTRPTTSSGSRES